MDSRIENSAGFELGFICDKPLAQPCLGMVPYLLIRVEFWTVAGQVLNSDLPVTLGGILPYWSAAMVTSAISDHDDRSAGIGMELL